MNAYTDQQIEAYLSGELSPASAADFEAAMAADPALRARVEAYAASLEETLSRIESRVAAGAAPEALTRLRIYGLEQEMAAPAAAPVRGLWTTPSRLWAVAAGVALLALVGLAYWLSRPAGLPGPQLAARDTASVAPRWSLSPDLASAWARAVQAPLPLDAAVWDDPLVGVRAEERALLRLDGALDSTRLAALRALPDGRSPVARLYLCQGALLQGELEQAPRDMPPAIEGAPAAYADTRSWVLALVDLAAGDSLAARDRLTELLAGNPGFARVGEAIDLLEQLPGQGE